MKNKEKRNQWIVAVICAILLILAFKTQGQIQTKMDIDHGKVYVCKTNTKPLSFNFSNTNDTLHLCMIADSISKDIWSIMLYTYYTEKMAVPDKGMKIWFPDGSYETFKIYEFNKKERFIKYSLVGHSYKKMKEKEIGAIEFNEVALCESVSNPKYFMNFLNSYNK